MTQLHQDMILVPREVLTCLVDSLARAIADSENPSKILDDLDANVEAHTRESRILRGGDARLLKRYSRTFHRAVEAYLDQ